VRKAYRESAFANATVVPYLDPMADAMAAADLVVSRAGAMTIGELCASDAPRSRPFAAATNNHQELNARVVERAGAPSYHRGRALAGETRRGDHEHRERPGGAGAHGRVVEDAGGTVSYQNIVDLIEKIQTK
jgi:hypothetical protein